MRTEEALAAMEAAGSIEQLAEILQKRIEGAGFAAFEFIDVTSSDGVRLLGAGTADGWRDVYASNGFDKVDPYIAKARQAYLPFDWASLSGAAQADPLVAQLMQAANDFGLREGFISPHHWRDHTGRRHDELCVLFWTGAVSDFRATLERARSDIHLLTLFFMQRAMRLREDDRFEPRDRTKLTPRERDVLCWAARGKTSAETAAILTISPLTAETHMRNATAKLGAMSKTHAVAVAMAHGLILP